MKLRSGSRQEYFLPESRLRSLTALEQFMLADLTLNMPSLGLVRLDRATMAHSLEARVPFLSHKMVDWALTVPLDLKRRGNSGKIILKQAIAPWLPPSLLTRPKQGFQFPLAAWMRGRLGEFARDAWHDSGAADAGYLDPNNVVERLFAEHRSRRGRPWPHPLFHRGLRLLVARQPRTLFRRHPAGRVGRLTRRGASANELSWSLRSLD